MISINNSKQFDSEIEGAGGKLVVIDFGANWCGPCKAVAPQFEQLAETYGINGNALFLKVNVDDCTDLAMKLNISALPTFMFFKNKVEPTFILKHLFFSLH